MKQMIATAAALAAAGSAHAAPVTVKALVDARLRYEHVDQDGFAQNADALTTRVRAGAQATVGAWSALVEGQGTLAAVADYDDGLNGPSPRPLVADPQSIGLYRAQLQYRTKALAVTAGRQRIVLDDERFVGNVAFRDNGQTFDAVRVDWNGVPKLKADVSYAWSVRTIWGVNGTGARQQAVSGDNLLANLAWTTPAGTLTGFAYLVDQDEAAVQAFRLSSQTYGIRLTGSRPLARDIKLGWQASYARQADWHRNPNRYRANYYLIDATLDIRALRLNAGYEVLGADRGAAFTSFQTPLATAFKFQGWADKFIATPPNGVRDLYGGAGYGWKALGPFEALSLQAVWHRFDSARLDLRYGDEINLLASAKRGRTTVSARYADYRAKGFANDTRKVWLQLDWTF